MVHSNSPSAGSTPGALPRAARIAVCGLAPALLCAAAWAQANPVPGQMPLVGQDAQSLNLRSTVRMLQPVVAVKAVAGKPALPVAAAPVDHLRQLTAEERILLRRQLTHELRAQRSGPETVARSVRH